MTPAFTVRWIAHHWPADFFRVFGRQFFTDLIEYQIDGGRPIIQALIRDGEKNPTKALNLTRSFQELTRVRKTHFQELNRRKENALADLIRSIHSAEVDDDEILTGMFVQQFDIIPVR